MTVAHPLQWPEGWPRTPQSQRTNGDQFTQRKDFRRADGTVGRQIGRVTFAVARDKLYEELTRLGATNAVISTNHPADARGTPLESKRAVADEGTAVYFTYMGKPMAMACDRYTNAAANMRSLGLAIEAMRQLDRHGGGTMMERAFAGFEALPAPKRWWEVLKVKPDCFVLEIEDAYRTLAKKHHPDVGGDAAQFAEISEARRQGVEARS